MVNRAINDGEVTDHRDDVIALYQLPCQAGDLRGIRLLGFHDVLHRPAVDAAVVVDAREVRFGHGWAVGEVDAGHLGRDRPDLDRGPGGLLAVAQAAFGLRPGCRT